ncbi:MAG: class I SAM-dependent methyltransferase family protein [Candidatus Aenigmatarchaeota archaeon]
MRIAFDVIGSKEKAVAIIDSRPNGKEKQVAKDIMSRYNHIKSVLVKRSPRGGIYRIYNLRIAGGSRKTEVIHKEHGMLFKLDPKKVFFSPRESTERQRLAEKVKKKERVLVMFSGIAPIAIAIAKKQPEAEIVCIEINNDAVDYANENLRLNMTYNIRNYCWDVRDAAGLGRFNRIIMPLPEKAVEYLDVAFKAAKKGAIIHLYGISRQKDFSDFKEKVKLAAKQHNRKIRVLSSQKVLPYAPYRMKIRLDIKVL